MDQRQGDITVRADKEHADRMHRRSRKKNRKKEEAPHEGCIMGEVVQREKRRQTTKRQERTENR